MLCVSEHSSKILPIPSRKIYPKRLPDIRLYDLRHTFATLWLESGEHPKILQEILGHSRISVTLDTYSHVIPHMQREAMSRFGHMFSKPS